MLGGELKLPEAVGGHGVPGTVSERARVKTWSLRAA